MRHEYSKKLRSKGWTAKEVAEWWGLSHQGVSKIVSQPTQRDWDALAGLPDRTKPGTDG